MGKLEIAAAESAFLLSTLYSAGTKYHSGQKFIRAWMPLKKVRTRALSKFFLHLKRGQNRKPKQKFLIELAPEF